MLSIIKKRISGLDSSKKDLLKGTSWILASTIFSKILIFCATIAVTHILMKEVYGQLGIIRSTVQMFLAVSSFGIGATATRYIAEYRNKDINYAIKTYWVSSIFIGTIATIASIVLICSSSYIGNEMLNAPHINENLKIAAFILFFSLLNGVQSGALSGFEDFKHMAFVNILNGVLEIILLPLGAYLFGLTGAVLGFGSCFLIVFIFNTYYVNKHLRVTGVKVFSLLTKLKCTDFSILYKFSLPMALSSWIIIIAYWIAKTMLIKDSDFGAMANYDVAEQIKAQLLFIPGILAQVLLPIITNRLSDNHSERSHSLARMNIKLNIFITTILFVIVLICGKYILLIYGSDYTSIFPLYLLCFSTIIDSVCNSYVPIIIANNKVWSVLRFNLIWGTIILLSYNILKHNLIPEDALSIAYTLAAIVQLLLMSIYLKRNNII